MRNGRHKTQLRYGLILAPMTSLRHSTDIGPPLACRRYRTHPPAPPRRCACGLQSLNETFGGWSGGANVAGAPEFMSTLSPGLGRGFFLGASATKPNSSTHAMALK
jgi:hypothetical protein